MIGAAVPADESYSPARREGCFRATISGNLNGNFSVSPRTALNDKTKAFWTRLKSPSCCLAATQHVRSRLAHINSIKSFSFLWSPRCAVLFAAAAASHLRFAIRSFFNDFSAFVAFDTQMQVLQRRKGKTQIWRRRCAFHCSPVSVCVCVSIDWYCIRENFVGITRSRKLAIAKPSFARSFFALADFAQLSLNHILLKVS